MQIELRPVDSIRPYDNNPRLNDQAVEAVAKSIREFGWRQPIVVDKDGVVHFSDQPGAANAVLITVIEPNSFEGDGTGGDSSNSGAATEQPSEPDVPSYRGLSITSPAADQVFFGADAVVSATAEVDGTLEPDHSIVFFLNGERRESDGDPAPRIRCARSVRNRHAQCVPGHAGGWARRRRGGRE